MAISCARRILVMVSGHHAPAFTVASLATITAGRPSILPSPVTTPAAGRLAVVAVVGDQQADFEEERAGSSSARDALARRHLAGAVLLFDARRRRRLRAGGLPACEAVRPGGACAPGARHPRLSQRGKIRRTHEHRFHLLHQAPLASDSACAFFHSGSAWNSAQCFSAASRLGCARI